MLDRAAFALLHLDDRLADEPQVLALSLRLGDRRIAHNALRRRFAQDLGHEAVEIARA